MTDFRSSRPPAQDETAGGGGTTGNDHGPGGGAGGATEAFTFDATRDYRLESNYIGELEIWNQVSGGYWTEHYRLETLVEIPASLWSGPREAWLADGEFLIYLQDPVNFYTGAGMSALLFGPGCPAFTTALNSFTDQAANYVDEAMLLAESLGAELDTLGSIDLFDVLMTTVICTMGVDRDVVEAICGDLLPQ